MTDTLPSFASLLEPIANFFRGRLPLLNTAGERPYGLMTDTSPVVIAASSSKTVQVTLQSDCIVRIDHWNAITDFGTVTAANWSFPAQLGFTVDISWGAHSWKLTSAAIRGELLFGTAQRPGRIGSRPWILMSPGGGSSVMNFDFTNLTTDTITVYVALLGYRRVVLEVA